MKTLTVIEVKELLEQGCVIVDTRATEIFCDGFIEESISIPYKENFVEIFQELMEDDQKVILVNNDADTAAITKAIKQAGAVNVVGFLQGGYTIWSATEKKIDMLITVEADEFAIDYTFDEFFLIDARDAEEYKLEHVEDAENIALTDMEQLVVELETTDSYYLYATTFTEAVTAASIFKRYGFERVRAVQADYAQLKETSIPFYKKKKDATSSKFSTN